MDISNDIEGHTLVIPKNHCKNILDCNDLDLAEVMKAVKFISNHYISLGYDGVNILNANEKAAEQSVFHLHFHIIPRKNDDGYSTFPKFDKNEITLEKAYNKFKI